MPQAVKPLSHESSSLYLDSSRFLGLALGHACVGKNPQTPLQTLLGSLQMHCVGRDKGAGLKPSLHVKEHGFLRIEPE